MDDEVEMSTNEFGLLKRRQWNQMHLDHTDYQALVWAIGSTIERFMRVNDDTLDLVVRIEQYKLIHKFIRDIQYYMCQMDDMGDKWNGN
jgi:hypothetical protein